MESNFYPELPRWAKRKLARAIKLIETSNQNDGNQPTSQVQGKPECSLLRVYFPD